MRHAPPTVAPSSVLRPNWETLAWLAPRWSNPLDVNVCPHTIFIHTSVLRRKPTNLLPHGFEDQTKKLSWRFYGPNHQTAVAGFEFYTSFKLENYTNIPNYRYIQSYITIISNNLIHTHKCHLHSCLTRTHKCIHTYQHLIHTSAIHTHHLIHTSIIHKHTSLLHRYRLGNFHCAFGGGGTLELWLPLEAKRVLTKSELGRSWNK
jgi:hypothetical protein